jgi:hypothetical protein
LLAYGESKLGCRAISPIWMSYYVDGCSQVGGPPPVWLMLGACLNMWMQCAHVVGAWVGGRLVAPPLGRGLLVPLLLLGVAGGSCAAVALLAGGSMRAGLALAAAC